jgi:hypothetical protein
MRIKSQKASSPTIDWRKQAFGQYQDRSPAMRNNTAQPQGPATGRPQGLPFPGQEGPDGAFWSGAIGAGAGLMVELAAHLDLLSHSIAQLPERMPAARPAVANYLAMVKALAVAWETRARPALVAALGALAQAGAGLAQPLTLAALAQYDTDPARAMRLVAGLRRRLATPFTALGALGAEFDELLTDMAGATRALQSDTLLVSERLRSDHVHAFLLSQQASTLQSKLDDANLRQDAYWLQGPHSEQIRQEIALHGSALEGVRRQIDHLHAEQAATRAEAHYLQKLMPSLAGYLGGLDRMASAVRATVAGTGAVLAELDELARMLAEDAPAARSAQDQLRAALPQWRALAASAARLRPGYGVKTRGGRRA